MLGMVKLDEVSHIHGHLFHGGVVECFNIPQGSFVVLSHHVDGYSFPAKATATTNPDPRTNSPSFSNSKNTLMQIYISVFH